MESGEQNLQTILEIAKRQKWSIVIPAVSLFVVIAVVALVIPPRYRSISTILSKTRKFPAITWRRPLRVSPNNVSYH